MTTPPAKPRSPWSVERSGAAFKGAGLSIRSGAARALAWIAVGLGAVEFVFRALLRTKSDWMSDLASPYISARLLLAGLNPYDPSFTVPVWYGGGAPHIVPVGLAVAASVYPPPTLLMVLPLALLRWQQAVHVFVATGLLLYAAVVYGLVRLGWPQHDRLSGLVRDPAATLFLAICLGFAPIHTAFHSVNIVLFACCAAILAVVISLRTSVGASGAVGASMDSGGSTAHLQRRTSSDSGVGVLVALATTAAICIKPTTGVFLLPWLVRERRWRWLTGVIVACALISAVSLVPVLAHQGLSWLPQYRQNVDALFTHGGNADVSAANFENTDRIDLQLVAFAAFGNRTLAAAAAGSIYICLLLAFLGRAGWRKDASSSELTRGHGAGMGMPLLVPSGCLALGLLPSYSRVYAAIVLLPLVLWCFQHLRFSAARWLLLLLADFLLNTSAIARLVGAKTGVIAYAPRLWDFTIGGHTCWLLLAIGGLLIYAVRQQTEEDARYGTAQAVGSLGGLESDLAR